MPWGGCWGWAVHGPGVVGIVIGHVGVGLAVGPIGLFTVYDTYLFTGQVGADENDVEMMTAPTAAVVAADEDAEIVVANAADPGTIVKFL